MKDKSKAYLLWVFGLHQFYLGRHWRGIIQYVIYLPTLGLWWIYDFFTLGLQVRKINHDFVLDELGRKYKYANKDIEGNKYINIDAEVLKVCDEMNLKVYEGYMYYRDAKVLCSA